MTSLPIAADPSHRRSGRPARSTRKSSGPMPSSGDSTPCRTWYRPRYPPVRSMATTSCGCATTHTMPGVAAGVPADGARDRPRSGRSRPNRTGSSVRPRRSPRPAPPRLRARRAGCETPGAPPSSRRPRAACRAAARAARWRDANIASASEQTREAAAARRWRATVVLGQLARARSSAMLTAPTTRSSIIFLSPAIDGIDGQRQDLAAAVGRAAAEAAAGFALDGLAARALPRTRATSLWMRWAVSSRPLRSGIDMATGS